MRSVSNIKEKVIENIHSQVKAAKQTIIINYQGLTTAQLTDLRIRLRTEGAVLQIYKNTLFNLGIKKTAYYEKLHNELVGPNAFIFATDNKHNLARFIDQYAKQNNEKKLKIKAGIFEEEVFVSENIKKLINAKTKTELLRDIVYTLKFPTYKLAMVLKALAEKKLNSVSLS